MTHIIIITLLIALAYVCIGFVVAYVAIAYDGSPREYWQISIIFWPLVLICMIVGIGWSWIESVMQHAENKYNNKL